MSVKEVTLVLLGFGNAGQEFARILIEKHDEWLHDYGVSVKIVGISTKTRGKLINPKGIDLNFVLRELKNEQISGKVKKFNEFPSEIGQTPDIENISFIQKIKADILIEITTLDIETGQPAIDHIKTSFQSHKHVITANKGPIAIAFQELQQLAKQHNKMFLFEGTVMDGAPVFNLFRETLLGNKVIGFRGILNATTNFILTEMENGASFDQALKEAQLKGFAEADPSMDIKGFDGSAKVAALLNVLMNANITPKQIECQGIEHITPADIQEAKQKGMRIKVLCEGYFDAQGNPVGKVGPALVKLDDPLALISGTTSALTLKTKFLKELTIIEHDGLLTETAYGIVVDLLTIIRAQFSV